MTEDSTPFQEAYDRIALELGHLLIQANGIEEMLVDLSWLLAQRTRVDAIAEIRNLTLGRLAAHVVAEFRRLPSVTLVARIDALEARLLAAVDARNEFVHAGWAVSVDGWANRSRRPRRGAARDEIVRLRPEHIQAATDKIGAVTDELWELWDATVAERGPLQFPASVFEYIDLAKALK